MDCTIDNANIHANFTGLLSKNTSSSLLTLCYLSPTTAIAGDNISFTEVQCAPTIGVENDCLYGTSTFWSFILLMCMGTIGFNVANSVSDATCFEMLGEKTMEYGAQRVWGTIGFGATALVSGIVVHLYQNDVSSAARAIAPAIVIMLIFGLFDIISIKWLHLPQFSNEGESILSKVVHLLSQKSIAIFLVFATLAGILDSFIIYYMFWHLEEVAERTGYMESIKLIEGCVVAAECLGGEILFFLVSGRILKRIGYVHCLSFCFLMYSIRLGLISIIPNPWWLVLIELFMQGCSYALCYTCIVAYASAIAPPGTTATVQGLVAGMDDGAGFAIGSIIGGQMYRRLGGSTSFRVFSIAALVTCIAHISLRPSDQNQAQKVEGAQKQSEAFGSKILTELSEIEPLQQKTTGNEAPKSWQKSFSRILLWKKAIDIKLHIHELNDVGKDHITSVIFTIFEPKYNTFFKTPFDFVFASGKVEKVFRLVTGSILSRN